MLNVREHVHLHNRFDLTLVDSTTGEVKQTAMAENVVLNSFWTYTNGNGSFTCLLEGVAMGTGAGTPAATDSALFSQAFYRDGVTQLSRTIAKPTSTLVGQITFPATTSYVGNLTEIGVRASLPTNPTSTSADYTVRLLTHAMLVDSEGNPITINKTDLDVLVVTVTLYMTLESSNGFIPFYNSNNTFLNILNTTSTSMSKGPLYTPLNSANVDYPRLTFYTCATEKRVGGALSVNTVAQAYTSRRKSVTGARMTTTTGNTTFYNGIGLSRHGYFVLPNTEVFPLYTMPNIPVGIGNGTQQDFDCPIPMFVHNTDTVYKNGVALVRGVDYTIDNLQNKPALPCIAAFNFADTDLPSVYHERATTFAANSKVPFSTQERYLYGFQLNQNVVFTANLSAPDTTVGRKVNTLTASFVSYQVGAASQNPASLPLTGSLIFEYSLDGATWLPLYTHTVTSKYQDSLSTTFATIEPYYVRMRFEGTYSVASGFTPLICFTDSTLYYAGSPIHFNTAPEDGAVITMDCQIDRPYKNENHVIDASIAIQF